MKKKIETEQSIHSKLRFEAIRGSNRLQFLLLEYLFFKDSEDGSALPLDLPCVLWPLALMLYVVKTRALALLRLQCYFVTLETKTVGLLAIEEHRESLRVASLGVAREYRRLGIGTYMLAHIEAIAKHMGKRWLEVDVWKKNIPAQRLYAEYGFESVQSKGTLCRMRKKLAHWRP